MNKNAALVITSISAPNEVLKSFASGCKKHGVEFILIGDTKSPAEFELDGCRFYSVSMQTELPFKFAALCPYKHYARKNIGYLLAAKNGAEIIVESDDDNFPVDPLFWQERKRESLAHKLEHTDWINIYGYFSAQTIWPRGYPLECLEKELPSLEGQKEEVLNCPIQQGLADENPDVDAVFRLTTKTLPLRFDKGKNLALGKETWCPFNSQNTTFFKEAFPLLYLPAYCSFRMTDIWRSFVAQRICWENNWHILFHEATVWQERNVHNLLLDFEQEIPGYLNNARIATTLKNLELKPGVEHLGENLMRCYQALVDMKLVGEAELPLLQAWLDDLATL